MVVKITKIPMPHEEQATPEQELDNLHYPEAITQVDLAVDSVVGEQTRHPNLLMTVDSYLELEDEARQTQRALALDFDIWTSNLSDEELQAQAKSHIDVLNQSRPEDPIDIVSASRVFLSHLIRPKWHEYFPTDDSPEATERWHGFVRQFPEHMQENLEELQEIDTELRQIASDNELMKEVNEARVGKIEIMRAASDYIGADRMIDKLAKKSIAIRSQAALSNRALTKREIRRLDVISEHMVQASEQRRLVVSSREVISEILSRRAIKDAQDLRRGLLLTEDMQDKIDYILPSLMAGRPVLLVGETGGAKTALAEFVAKEYIIGNRLDSESVEPEFISGHAEVNSYQLVGKMSIKDGDTQFDPGPMIRAMEQGKPLILDEINAMPADFLKRLNKVMQLRPGDSYIPQEDSGREVKIKSGFCIIATANEKSDRYKGVNDLSVEFQNRFGANVVRVGYPDANVPDGQPPKDNLRLALAFLSDRSGEIDPSIDMQQVGSFVRAAHVTQKLFTKSDIPDYVDSDTVRDGLKEAVIAPRTMIDILSKIKEGHDFNEILSNFAAGFKNASDRKAITIILEEHGFDLESRDTESSDSNTTWLS